ncbi:MAG: hypothetical protein RSC24_06685 [Clostridium sp.]
MNNLVKLICDTHKGIVHAKFSNTSRTEIEDAIRKEFFEVLGVDTYGTKAYRNAMRRKSAEIFEIIEEMVDRIVIDGDKVRDEFFNQFAEVKNLALGDTNEFYAEGANTLSLAKFSGGHFDIKRQRVDIGSAFQVEMSDYGIAIFEYFDRFLAGRCDLAKLVALAQEAINKGVSEAIYTAFNEVLTKLPSQFIASGSYDEANILATLGHVEADNNGQMPVLVGTRTAISKLQGKSTIEMSDDMKNQKNTLGYVEMWNGYKCITLPQVHKKGTFEFAFDDTKILALPASAKPVKVCFEGDSQVKEISENGDNSDKSVQTTITLKFGTAIVFSNMIGTITLV